MRVIISFMFVVMALSSCVTTVDGYAEVKVDKKKVLNNQIELGMGYLGQKDREAARFHFIKALKIDKNSAEAISGMGLVSQYDGEPELAEKYFQRALKLKDNFAQGYNNYGSFLYGKNRFDEAYDNFTKAAAVVGYRNRSGALTNLGRAALQMKRIEKAQASFEHAVKLNPRQSIALIELADMYYVKEDYAESKKMLDQFEKVTRSTPRSLWLGIRIEQVFENKDKEASYALALKNLHPYSKEYLNYKKMKKNDR